MMQRLLHFFSFSTKLDEQYEEHKNNFSLIRGTCYFRTITLELCYDRHNFAGTPTTTLQTTRIHKIPGTPGTTKTFTGLVGGYIPSLQTATTSWIRRTNKTPITRQIAKTLEILRDHHRSSNTPTIRDSPGSRNSRDFRIFRIFTFLLFLPLYNSHKTSFLSRFTNFTKCAKSLISRIELNHWFEEKKGKS